MPVLAFWHRIGKLGRVTHFWASPLLRSRYLLAVLAGLLLAASFPRTGIAGLAWVAPALMLAAALGKSGWESFRIGYVGGLAYYLASLYWLLLIPYRWHSIPLGPALGWLSLSAYVALYPATWVWLLNMNLTGRSRVPASPDSSGSLPRIARIFHTQSRVRTRNLQANGATPVPHSALRTPHSALTWGRRTLWAIWGAALWVALEMLRARLFTGFPWNPLGASQYQLTPLTQIVSVTGVYGLSFLIIWASLSLLSAGLMVVLRPTTRSSWAGEILLPVIAIAGVLHFGFRQLAFEPAPSRSLKVTLIQPSIPQTLIWDTSRDLERFRDVLQLSENALTNRTDLLIWPESAIPSYARWDTNIYHALTNLVRRHNVWLIIGSDDAGAPSHPTSDNDLEYYNASFLINPEGEFVARYIKRNLVVFGEYIPLVRWLPFLKWFTPIGSGFTPGNCAVPFALTAPKAKTSTLICFEDIFPTLARTAVDEDTDFLVNLTNNGWFGESAAQWQHAAAAVFRAIENRLPLIRCSNNGLTGWVDAHGRLRQVFYDAQGTIYGPGFLTADIPLLAPGEARPPTPYRRYGDRFGWTCVSLTVLVLIIRLVRRSRTSNRSIIPA
ncbi:MAG TPA: apolipoprotein N-acyltransferase [Verrucomicrobiota bacterium]|mgnify:CR=1 FL=1|nr:apolipoprotein N-acyltransferase [Verrucomicrobiota bacterium]HQL78010.1 apolipoprotein N-acyltransferase [Verrucomicrobiota bacterium]